MRHPLLTCSPCLVFFSGALDAREPVFQPRDGGHLLLEAGLQYGIELLVVVALDSNLVKHVHLVIVPLVPTDMEWVVCVCVCVCVCWGGGGCYRL